MCTGDMTAFLSFFLSLSLSLCVYIYVCVCVSLSFFLCMLLMYTPLTFDSSPLRRRRHTANGVRSFVDVWNRDFGEGG